MASVNPERCLRVRLLLAREGERGIHGRDEARPGARPAPTSWLDCKRCNGTGRSGACDDCRGTGLVLVDPYTAGYDVDGIDAASGRKLPRLADLGGTQTMTGWEIDRVLARLAEQAVERGETDPRLTADVPAARGEPYEHRELRRVLLGMRATGGPLEAAYDAIRAVHWPAISCLACNGRGQRRRSDRPGDVAICLTCLGQGRPVPTRRVLALEELGVRLVAIRFRGRVNLDEDGELEVAAWRRQETVAA